MTVEHLMELDKQFSDTVNKMGAEAWASHFLEEGTMVLKIGENIVTKEAIYRAMKPFFENKGNSLLWHPESGGISDDGSLGYTYGKYKRITMDDKNDIKQETGRYLTIWRKVNENSYSIETDIGN